MSPSPQEFQFEVGSVLLAGERWQGDDDSLTPAVLLHGGGQTRHSWGRTAQRLAAGGRTAIALDTRGHGDSAWDPEMDYSLDAAVGDLVAFLRSLDRPAALVGASFGGATSLAVAGEHPELAAALVLVDVVIDAEPAGVERILEFMTAHQDGFASLDEVADAIAAYNPVRKRPRNLAGLRKNVRKGEDGRWYWHWDPAFIAIDGEPQSQIQPERLREAAKTVVAPTLIVRGLQSEVVSDSGVASMLDLIPAAEVADVKAAGHMVAGDDNDVFAGALEEFLARAD